MYQARRKHNSYRRKVLQEAKKLVKRVREELHPVEVFLFGSVARGDAHALSDIDLLIVADFQGLCGADTQHRSGSEANLPGRALPTQTGRVSIASEKPVLPAHRARSYGSLGV